MAYFYIGGMRDQPLLLPVDMHDWLDEGHLARFVIDVVERIDTSGLHARHPNDGVGRPAYDPDMMLSLLLYAYATSQRSSRRIEAACRTDAAYRFITGNVVPDHATIARFVVHHEQAIAGLFTQVLMLCVDAELIDTSVVAIDGTKRGSDAALDRNMTLGWVREQVDHLLTEIRDTDRDEDHTAGQAGLFDLETVAAKVATRSQRLARLEAAVTEAQRQQTAIDTQARASQTQAFDAAAQGRKLTGRKPQQPAAAHHRAQAEQIATHNKATRDARARLEGNHHGPDLDQAVTAAVATDPKVLAAQAATASAALAARKAADTAKINITDPDSRIMKAATGWIQGYNLQAATDRNQFIIGHLVSQERNDVDLYQPMVHTTLQQLNHAMPGAHIGMVVADAGYWSETNATAPGPDRLLATLKDHKQRRAARELGATTGDPPTDASALDAMEHRLRTPEGTATSALRCHLVEPIFCFKTNHGYQRFKRRGLDAARSEWALIATVHNLTKLHRHTR